MPEFANANPRTTTPNPYTNARSAWIQRIRRRSLRSSTRSATARTIIDHVTLPGILVLVAAVASGLAALATLRLGVATTATLLLMALAGALAGLGGLLVQDGVSAGEWVAATLVLAALGVFHARLLFAGD